MTLRCEHLSEGISIESASRIASDPSLWVCEEGEHSSESLWMCFQCGHVGCGRFHQRHALLHRRSTGHNVVFDIKSGAVFCYECDSYVLNDTPRGDVEIIRDLFQEMRKIHSSAFRIPPLNPLVDSFLSDGFNRASVEEDEGKFIRKSGVRTRRQRQGSIPGVLSGHQSSHDGGEEGDKNPRDRSLMVSVVPEPVAIFNLEDRDKLTSALIHWRNIELWKSWVRWRTFSSIHKLKRGSGEVVDTPPPSPIHGSCESLQSLDSRILQQSEEDIESEGLDQEEGESLEDPSFDDLTVIDLFSSSSQIKLGGPHEMNQSTSFSSLSHASGEEPLTPMGEINVALGLPPYALTTPLLQTPYVSDPGKLSFFDTMVQLSSGNQMMKSHVVHSFDEPTPETVSLHLPLRPRGMNRPTGLRNLGNCCFMNATIQALSHIFGLRKFFLRLPVMALPVVMGLQLLRFGRAAIQADLGAELGHAVEENEEVFRPLLALEMQTVFRVLKSRKVLVYTPHHLLSSVWRRMPMFRGYQQQDAEEFTYLLLESIDAELRSATQSSHLPVVTRLLQGELVSSIICSTCSSLSSRKENFFILPLVIPSKHPSNRPNERTPKKAMLSVPLPRLEDCIAEFFRDELLQGADRYDCETCSCKRDAVRSSRIVHTPNVLCLSLKRFVWPSKVNTIVAFPIDGLVLRPPMVPHEEIYDLVSVVVHHGRSPNSGHYTCYSRDGAPVDLTGRLCNSWFWFNDAQVRAVDEEDVRMCRAYLLFYQRRRMTSARRPSHSSTQSRSLPFPTPLLLSSIPQPVPLSSASSKTSESSYRAESSTLSVFVPPRPLVSSSTPRRSTRRTSSSVALDLQPSESSASLAAMVFESEEDSISLQSKESPSRSVSSSHPTTTLSSSSHENEAICDSSPHSSESELPVLQEDEPAWKKRRSSSNRFRNR